MNIMKLITLSPIIGFLFLISVETTAAQPLVSWEIRGGADVATQELGDANLNTGYGFDGILSFWFKPYISVYAGWGWHQFPSDDPFAGASMDFTETGYTFGLEFMYPLGNLSHGFYLRGGGIYNQVQAESRNGDITADSGHGLGWQAETGLAFDLGYNWVLKPGVRYRSLSEDIEIGDTTTDIDLRYLNFAIGISRSF